MSETLNLSTSRMTDADLKAIATYLKGQPGKQQSAPTASDDATMKMGAKIYADECSGCHTASGKGIVGIFPSLAGSAGVQQSDPTSLLHVVLRGARGTGTDSAPTAASMPAFGWVLKDDQIAAVLTYIRNSWGNAAPQVSAGDVSAARRLLPREATELDLTSVHNMRFERGVLRIASSPRHSPSPSERPLLKRELQIVCSCGLRCSNGGIRAATPASRIERVPLALPRDPERPRLVQHLLVFGTF